MKNILCVFTLIWAGGFNAQISLSYQQNETPEYNQVIEYYREIDRQFENASLREMGPTDSGRKLHVFLISTSPIGKDLDFKSLTRNKVVILINNGIHPGESCGIDASIKFAEQLLQNGVPENVVFAIIPVYNIGGALNRNVLSRANQQGPKEHGFRGNSRNLDLNRDFIKADALNTLSFYSLFQALQPHIFIDTHTSNGADYQYTMTLISTHKDKLNPALSRLLVNDLEPYLYKNMRQNGWEMTPYVNVFGSTPDKGFSSFLETPRYASGYTALFNTIGFITEAHMLKPYENRVESTLSFLHLMADYTNENALQVIEARQKAWALDSAQKYFATNWELDSSAVARMQFRGYEYDYIQSAISNTQRLKYYSDRPKTFTIDYFHRYKATDSITLPQYYVVPAAWHEVPLRLQYNNVKMIPLRKDTVINVQSYYIREAEFSMRPYEGHFPIQKMKVEKVPQERRFLKGDYLVPTNQKNRRFIAAVLEPSAVDSYLRWNFYDEIFQQKEYFSAYVFEDTAEELLRSDTGLRSKFEKWKADNPVDAARPYAALRFIYQNTDYYEKEHLRYPVARIE